MRHLLSESLAPGRDTVVMVSSDAEEALFLPWELARSPEGRHLSRAASGMARQRRNVMAPMVPPQRAGGVLRVLLVVSRPQREEDVEYQAVAARLLDRMEGRAQVRLVRPGTFQAFQQDLADEQWDLVHYDGHGTAGRLVFEDGLITAERLGEVLAGANVPVFALNACQSAVADEGLAQEEREVASVAQALVRTGATGVVAMGASVRVSSAVTFFDRFYEELADGATLARAAHRARRAMEAAEAQGPLDWAIPVLYLREDVAPFAGRQRSAPVPLDILAGKTDLTTSTAGARTGGEIFIGRDGDLYRLDRALDEFPRVLLYGVGGIGKTTLTEYLLQWRRRTGGCQRVLAFSFRHAPSFEALAQVFQADVVAVHPEATQMFQSPQWAATPLEHRLTRLGQVLATDGQPKRLLLFDNLETLAGYPEVGSGPYTDDERALFRALLVVLTRPRCWVVMTSRRDEMELLGDTAVRLRLVGIKGRYRLPLLQAYTRLFDAERRLRGALENEEGKTQLGELLRVLAGHPLATRVAAYGLRDRGIGDVLASVQGKAAQIPVPVSEQGTRSENLEQVLAGVLEPLPEERRRALGLLGLFAGQFHQADLFGLVTHERFPAGVVADRTEEALRHLLTEADRLGLMAPSESIDRVWEVVPGAQAALDRLWRETLNPDVTRRLEQHFVQYWAATAAIYMKALHSRERAEWAIAYGYLDEGNLRLALQGAEAGHDWAASLIILRLFLELWPMQGRIKDADHLRAAWLKKVTDPTGDPISSANEELVSLWYFLWGNAANRHLMAGELDQAWAIYHKVVDGLETRHEKSELISAGYHQLGMVEQFRGDLEAAEQWYRKSLQIREEMGDQPGMAMTYHHLGMVEQFRGEFDAAEDWYSQSLKIEETLGNRPGIASSYHQLGTVAQDRGDLDAAERFYRKSLEIEVALGNMPGMASSYGQLGILEQARGNLDIAEQWYRKSLTIQEELGNRLDMAKGYHQLGSMEHERNNFDTAEQWYRKSLAITEQLPDRPSMARTYGVLGLLYWSRGDLPAALQHTLQAFALFVSMGFRQAATAAHTLAQLYREMGEASFLRICDEIGAPHDLLHTLLAMFETSQSPE